MISKTKHLDLLFPLLYNMQLHDPTCKLYSILFKILQGLSREASYVKRSKIMSDTYSLL